VHPLQPHLLTLDLCTMRPFKLTSGSFTAALRAPRCVRRRAGQAALSRRRPAGGVGWGTRPLTWRGGSRGTGGECPTYPIHNRSGRGIPDGECNKTSKWAASKECEIAALRKRGDGVGGRHSVVRRNTTKACLQFPTIQWTHTIGLSGGCDDHYPISIQSLENAL